ncbi:VOC family protein [Kiloniella antarctica]|uniref:VOC family protein n=1 Tax=Kiloniella antarctica TaxID=1550907 RepID=A0ABW5BJK8_9PROT
MIIPNLMVRDIQQSLGFYRDLLGMKIVVFVSPANNVSFEGSGQGVAFATLEWKGVEGDPASGGQLMLQTPDSLASELDCYAPSSSPTASGTIYFRGFSPDELADKISPDLIIKGPLVQWYGMKELYLRDPDGYVICLGIPDGSAPQ